MAHKYILITFLRHTVNSGHTRKVERKLGVRMLTEIVRGCVVLHVSSPYKIVT
jgi:hypothetical protein